MRSLIITLTAAALLVAAAPVKSAPPPYEPFAIRMAVLLPSGTWATLTSKARFADRPSCEVARKAEAEALAAIDYRLLGGLAVGSVCTVPGGVET